MNLALIGYGKMGRLIEEIALERGHKIVSVITSKNRDDIKKPEFRTADAAIEFTSPAAAFENCKDAIEQGVKVVSGSTGWNDRLPEIRRICEEHNGALFHSSNFSIGVNVTFAVNEYLAQIMNRFSQYDVDITEIHHIHKLDHPSGTAISLADGIISNLDRKDAWSEDADAPAGALKINSEREGEVPGTHIIKYKSDVDEITLKHEAFSRRGFALGAVVAAEWIKDRQGFFTMADMLNLNNK